MNNAITVVLKPVVGILIYEMLSGYPPFFDDTPFGIYEKILAGRIEFPKYFDAAAIDLISQLLTRDRTRRLGNLKACDRMMIVTAGYDRVVMDRTLLIMFISVYLFVIFMYASGTSGRCEAA